MTTISYADFAKVENWDLSRVEGFAKEILLVKTPDWWWWTRHGMRRENRLAVSGSMGSNWAVRVFLIGEQGPALVASWDGNSSLMHATATTLSWIAGTGRLVSGVEHVIGNRSAVRIQCLDPENNESIEFVDLPEWESVVDLQEDPSNEGTVLVLGNGDGLGKCLSFNPDSKALSNQFPMEKIEQPAGLGLLNGQVWVAGQAGKAGVVEIFVNGKFRHKLSLGRDFFISEIEASGERIYRRVFL